MPIPSGRVTRRRSRAAILLAAAGIAGAVTVPTFTAAQPGSVSGQQAEVERLKAELAEADRQVSVAAEAYNGARYELQQAQEGIRRNTELIGTSRKRLVTARVTLSERLRNIYASPPPSLVQVVVDSGSITGAVDSVQLFERIGEQDGQIVEGIRTDLDRLAEARIQLQKDRAAAADAVTEAAERRDEVLAILRRRQQVLDSAEGKLRRLLAEERERERRAAEAERQRALAVQRSATPDAPATAGTAAPVPQSAPTAPVGSSGNGAVVGIAMQYLGVPYVWGGASPSGFDCSGLASYVYGKIGKSVPHYTGAIWGAFPRVASGDLQPGDLVFFRADLGHMGIYIGGGQYIHAPQTGDVVKISSLGGRSDYQGAVRP